MFISNDIRSKSGVYQTNNFVVCQGTEKTEKTIGELLFKFFQTSFGVSVSLGAV